jgi:hypothetical protein
MQQIPQIPRDPSSNFRQRVEAALGRTLTEEEIKFCALAEQVVNTDKPRGKMLRFPTAFVKGFIED